MVGSFEDCSSHIVGSVIVHLANVISLIECVFIRLNKTNHQEKLGRTIEILTVSVRFVLSYDL